MDEELVAAIDAYLAMLRKRLIERVKVGMHYQGKWKSMTTAEVVVAAQEEEDDLHVYRAMIHQKFDAAHL